MAPNVRLDVLESGSAGVARAIEPLEEAKRDLDIHYRELVSYGPVR